MSIRTRILLACLSLTAITVLLGAYAYQTQRDLGRLGTRIYDDTVLAISYLRSAQHGLSSAEAQWLRQGTRPNQEATADLANAISDIQGDLEVAHQRAMSPAGANAVARVRDEVQRLTHVLRVEGPSQAFANLEPLESDFATAIEVYAADGFRYRRSVGELVLQASLRTWVAVGVSVAVALIITAFLSRSILPPLHRAFAIAQAIAAGRLDNQIETSGHGETGELLHALDTMQCSIATGMARIQTLMEQQQRSHAGELEVEHAKLSAALDNMSQGLCLFSNDGRLLVTNQRFGQMFVTPIPGATLDDILGDDRLAALRGIDHGAVGSFSCPLDDGRVIAVSHRPVAGGGWVATYEDVTERHAADAKLAHMARHDALTGLPNRLMLSEHMPGALAHARRYGGLALLYLDLDRFKAVNDALGHAAGDALLRAVAQRLRDCTRETDLIVRLGGDEFVIVQEHSSQPADSASLAQRLIETLSAPYEIEQQRVTIGTSIGIALSEGCSSDGGTLLKCADLALYRAKADGRGTFCYFESEMDEAVQTRRMLELDLRQALANDEFEVFYQPLVVASSCEISGFEALLRWRHPARGLISPAVFIPLAEDLGLITAMGEWTLRQACADAAGWPETLKVAVNLSPIQFRGQTLVSHVANALALSGLPASRLELEITESMLLQDDDRVLATLHELHGLGARIAMDDFGTGYSSLSYLRRFPFDKIKIDQSFVRSMIQHEDSRAIIRAIIGLGRSLGMTINAEGVETPDQLAALQAEGCGELQGFLFSQPEPAEKIAKLLRTRPKFESAVPATSDPQSGIVILMLDTADPEVVPLRLLA